MIANSKGKILWTSVARCATERCALPPVPESPSTRNLIEPSFIGSSSRSCTDTGAASASITIAVAITRCTVAPPWLLDRIGDEVDDQVGVHVTQDKVPVDDAILEILGELGQRRGMVRPHGR